MMLSPAESQATTSMSPNRRGEFAAGRMAARLALAELGVRGHDLVVAPDRRPVWPSDIVGSITHTEGFCAAAVAKRQNHLGVGIDAERLDRPIVGQVRDSICHRSELDAATDEPHAAHVIFSAKESFFKAYYPQTLHWIGFHDANVVLSPADNSFQITLISPTAPRPAGLASVSGRYAITGGLVLSAVTPVG